MDTESMNSIAVRRAELCRSLQNPHADSVEFAEQGLEEWATGLPEEAEALVINSFGRSVRWVPGEGWLEPDEESRQ